MFEGVREVTFYSPRRSVPTNSNKDACQHRLQEDKDESPMKAQARWRLHRGGPPWGSVAPQVAPPWLYLPWLADRWALVLGMCVLGLCTLVCPVKWALLVSVTRDWIFYVFVLHLVYVFILFRIWVPANQESPKLVELVRIKPYN